MPLTPEQSVAMSAVKDANKHLRGVASYAKEEARKLEVRLNQEAIDDADKAVRRAYDAKISMTRIANEGMDYANPFWVRESLRRTGGSTGSSRARRDVNTFHLLPSGDVAVRLMSYPTTSLAPEYPSVLAGVVRPDESAPNGWLVIEDATDQPGLPGFLHWEVERRNMGGSHLANELTAWAQSAEVVSA